MINKIVVMTLLCSFGLFKQAAAQIEFSVGVKAGVNVSKFTVDEPTPNFEINFHAGFNVGIMTLVKIAKFGIQPEVLFSRQGPSFEVAGLKLVSIQDYVNVPIVFKYYPIGGLNIQFGPQFGFLVAAESDRLVLSSGTTVSIGGRQDMKDAFNEFDFGLTMGLGWDLPFGLTVDARYNMGLTAINNNVEPVIGGEGVKNQVIQISVGYKLIRLGKAK